MLFCGGLFLIAGALRLGFIAQFLSRPVIEGFVFGLAIFVTVSQLPKLFGIEKGSGDTIAQFVHLIGHLGDASGATLAVGAGALVLLFGVERVAPKVPGGLLALVLGILVSSVFSLSAHGVFSESLGAAETFATKYGYEIDPNQELIALGVANAGSGLLGGLPAGGSLSQSAVNEGAGARSEISPLLAVSHLWKIAEMRRYYMVQRLEFWLALATFLGVITIDALPGLIIGVASMLLLVIYHASRPQVGSLGRVPGEPSAYGDIGTHPDYKRIPGLLVLRLEAPLFYANATPVRDRIKTLVGGSDPPPEALILDIGSTERLDITSAETLSELVRTMRSARIDVALAEVRQPMIRMARRSGLTEELGDDRIFHTIDGAFEALGS